MCVGGGGVGLNNKGIVKGIVSNMFLKLPLHYINKDLVLIVFVILK